MNHRHFFTFLFFVLLSALVAADTLTEFDEALDTYQYEVALELAQRLPEGPARLLAQAEHAIASGRPDRSFLITDKLDVHQIPTNLMGKYYLVRAGQEQATDYPLYSKRRKAVKRMLRDGLRKATRPRDKAALLLKKIRSTRVDRIALAQEAAGEIAELEVSPHFGLLAQATIADIQGRYGQSSPLWKSLSDTAGLKKQFRAKTVYAIRHGNSLWRLGKRERALKIVRSLYEQSLQRSDTHSAYLSVERLASYYRTLDRTAEREQLLDQFQAWLPDSLVKLRLLNARSSGLEGEAAVKLCEQGVALAKSLKEPLLEAHFLSRLASRLPYYVDRRSYRERALALIEPTGVRGTRYTWFSSVAHLKRDLKPKAELDRENLTPQTLASRLAELSGPNQAKARLKVRADFLRAALGRGRASLAEECFFRGLEEALELPESDREAEVDDLVRILFYRTDWGERARPYLSHLEYSRPVARAIGWKLSQNRELVSKVLGLYLNQLETSSTAGAKSSKLLRLGHLLSVLGRQDEAMELYQAADFLLRDDTERARQYVQQDMGGLLLEMDRVEGLKLLEPAMRRRQKPETSWKNPLKMGWLALRLGSPEVAEKWVRESMANRPTVELGYYFEGAPYELLALALAGQGKAQEGLDVLDQGMLWGQTVEFAQLEPLYATRAQILIGMGKLDEAEKTLHLVSSKVYGTSDIYKLRIKRDLAIAQGDEEESAALYSRLTSLLDKATERLGGGVYLDHFMQAYAEDLKLDHQKAPVTAPSEHHLAEVIEELERLRRREPDNQTLRRLSAGDIKRLMTEAKAGELYVQPVLLSHSVVALCVGPQRVHLSEVFCDRTKLDQAMVSLSSGLAAPDSNREFLEKQRRYLSRWLVEPWRSEFPEAKKVRWMGDERLQRVPLSVLYEGDGSPLLASLALTYLDGPTNHTGLKVGKDTPALLIGGAQDLEGAAKELSHLRQLYPQGHDWRLGQQFEQLRSLAPKHRLFHISTHGAAPSDQDLGGRLDGDEGALSAFDLAELKIPEGSLAVLGVCKSRQDADTGHDNSSLVSALRTAGADVVVGSLWELDDQVAVEFFASFYAALQSGADPESALVTAQRAVEKVHAHPYYWAGLLAVSGP